MKPHDNPYWRAKRRERDIERILQGKPIENDTLRVVRAPNFYTLAWKMIFARGFSFSIRQRAGLASALLVGLLVDLWYGLTGREPKPKPASSESNPETDEFPF